MPLRPLLLPALLLLAIAAAACTQPRDQPAPALPTPTETPAQPDAAPSQTQLEQPASDQQNDAQPQPQTSSTQTETAPEPAAPAPPDDSDDQTLPLAPRPYDHDFALSIAHHLATEIGPRPAGQPAETQAADYLASTFRQLGYDAQIIPFSRAPRSPWLARFGTGTQRPVAGLLAEGAASAPASGPLILIDGIGTPGQIAAADPEGAILVVDRGQITFGRKALNAQAAGAAGLIVVNHENRPVIALIEETGIAIPVVVVPSSARQDLAPAAGRNADLAPQPAGDPSAQRSAVDSANVLAAWPGGDCRILIGAHYDSVPIAPGGNDNASGTAALAALARAFAETAAAPHLCFAAFGAEELGLLGSHALVDQLRQDDRLAQIAAMINLDAIGGGDRPIQLIGSGSLAAIAAHLAGQLGIAVQDSSAAASPASDHLPFEQRGIPVLAFFAPNPIIHVPTDTYENLDSALMNDIARLAHAAIACIAADLRIPIQTPLPCESA